MNNNTQTVKEGILEARSTLINRRFVGKELGLLGIITFALLAYLYSESIISFSPAIVIPLFIILVVFMRKPKVYKIYSMVISIIWGILAAALGLLVGFGLPFFLGIPFSILMFVVGFRFSMRKHKNV